MYVRREKEIRILESRKDGKTITQRQGVRWDEEPNAGTKIEYISRRVEAK